MTANSNSAPCPSILVKVCGLTTTDDVIAAIDAGVDAVGFVFSDGPCQLDYQTGLPLVTEARDRGVCTLGIAGRADAETAARVRALGVDLVQIVVGDATQYDVPILPAFFDAPDVVACIDGFLRKRAAASELADAQSTAGRLSRALQLDGGAGGGKGIAADWGRARTLAQRVPLMLAGGLNSSNVATAIRQVRPMAVDVCTGVERAPGRKDHGKLRAFVSEVRRVERGATR